MYKVSVSVRRHYEFVLFCAGERRLAASVIVSVCVCLSVCPQDKTKVAESTIKLPHKVSKYRKYFFIEHHNKHIRWKYKSK